MSPNMTSHHTDSHSQDTLPTANTAEITEKPLKHDNMLNGEKKGAGNGSDSDIMGDELGLRNTMHEGELMEPEKFHRLGWMRLTICLIVEAIALGSLSIPSAFATLGMVGGVICCIGFGLIAIYTSYLVGEVKLKYPHIVDYADAVGLMGSKVGRKTERVAYEITGVMFALFLILITGSHTLTGTIAFVRIVAEENTCALVWGILSAILLFLVALPPTFHEFAVLGYIDFVSICIAILITIIATGIKAGQSAAGINGQNWSAWPAEDTTFPKAILAATNIVLAYSFAVCQYSFMAEMHTPKDYIKSIWTLGFMQIFIYTLTGGLVYAFVGVDVESPALLSAGATVSRIAFGIALPVIFISGSINTTVVSRYIMSRAFARSNIRFINTRRGWMVWIGLVAVIILIAWIVAEAIPFFNALLGLISSLFISGFSFYFPAAFWFTLLKEGSWKSPKNIMLSIINGIVFIIGLAIFGLGTYASVEDIIGQYAGGAVRSPFTCSAASYE